MVTRRSPSARSLLILSLIALGSVLVVALLFLPGSVLAPPRRSGYAAVVQKANWTGTPGQFSVSFILSREDGATLPSRMPDLGAATLQNGHSVPLPRLQFPSQKTEWLGVAADQKSVLVVYYGTLPQVSANPVELQLCIQGPKSPPCWLRWMPAALPHSPEGDVLPISGGKVTLSARH